MDIRPSIETSRNEAKRNRPDRNGMGACLVIERIERMDVMTTFPLFCVADLIATELCSKVMINMNDNDDNETRLG